MRNPQIDHIMTFIQVVEHGSFTAAADKLRLSKSIISKHVTALEEALETQLFERSTRKLAITEPGLAYYQEVKIIPEHLAAGQNVLQPFTQHPKGILKVITPANLTASLKKQVIPEYLINYPEVDIQLRSVRPVSKYVGENFDVIILWKLSHMTFPDYNLIAKKLLSLPIQIYATPAYLKQYGTPKKPEDLLKHNCFASVGNHWPFKTHSGSVKFLTVSGRLHTKNDEVIQGAVLAGAGITYSYPFLFQEALLQKQVTPILEQYTHLNIDVAAFYHPSQYLPRKTSAFIETLLSYYENF